MVDLTDQQQELLCTLCLPQQVRRPWVQDLPSSVEGSACEELYTGLVIHGQMAWVHSQNISGAWKSRKRSDAISDKVDQGMKQLS